MNNTAAAPLFRAFPLYGNTKLPSGVIAPTPYHNYDSEALLIHGMADADKVKAVLYGNIFPVLCGGKAIMSIWIIDYKNTSLGPYKEMVVSFLVSDEAGKTAKSLHAVNILSSQPGYHQYVWKLWLDKDYPIEYGRVLLGCDKHKADITIDRTADTIHFEISPVGTPILSGTVTVPKKTHIHHLLGELGMNEAIRFTVAPQPYVRWSAITPPAISPAYDTQCAVWGALFDTKPSFAWLKDQPTSSVVVPKDSDLSPFEFQPYLLQFDAHLKAVLLSPWTGRTL